MKKRIKARTLDKTNSEIHIRGNVSAIENYLALNSMSLNPWKIVPMTSSKQPYVGFTERELAGFFYKKDGVLKKRIMDLAARDGRYTTIAEIQSWIGTKEPGFLIKNFVADIDPKGLKGRQKRKAGRRSKIELLSLGDLKRHLESLDKPDFLPSAYSKNGYISRGSVLTDGFGLYLLAFKLKELQSVRFRRLPDDRLPPRITSTVGGTNYFLHEIRNLIQGKDDIEKLWPKVDPSDIKILTLDAGQAFVVGAYAHLPEDPDGHYNLAVNQKAVMQPGFRYRRWLENEKKESISEMESRLPPHRGLGASVTKYCNALKSATTDTSMEPKDGPEELPKASVGERLLEFYTGAKNRFKRHGWDQERAKQAEYQAIAASLLDIVGGNIGQKLDPANPVLIGVGLGQFKSTGRISSLHSTFLDYFIPLVCMLFEMIANCSNV